MARKQQIEIDSRLGRRSVDTDKVLYFPRGLAGFEGLHEFTLLQIRPEGPLLLLQSMDNPTVGLLVADPFSFIPDYQIKVSDAEQKLLCVKNPGQVAVLVTVSIPAGKPEETKLNLTGPILLNHEARIGLQVPQSEGPSQVTLSSLTRQPAPQGGHQDANKVASASEGAEVKNAVDKA